MAYRVLIVDNATYARKQLRSLLESHGYQVVGEAPDTATAIDLYLKHKPDVVTIDILLTGENGLNTVRAIKKADENARMIIVSAVKDEGTQSKADALGVKAYVTKPEEWPALEAALAKALKPN